MKTPLKTSSFPRKSSTEPCLLRKSVVRHSSATAPNGGFTHSHGRVFVVFFHHFCRILDPTKKSRAPREALQPRVGSEGSHRGAQLKAATSVLGSPPGHPARAAEVMLWHAPRRCDTLLWGRARAEAGAQAPCCSLGLWPSTTKATAATGPNTARTQWAASPCPSAASCSQPPCTWPGTGRPRPLPATPSAAKSVPGCPGRGQAAPIPNSPLRAEA